MKFNILFENSILLALLMFALVILGFCISLYLKITNLLFLGVLVIICSSSSLILIEIYLRFFQNRSKKFNQKYRNVTLGITISSVLILPIVFSLLLNSKLSLPMDINLFYSTILLIFGYSMVFSDWNLMRMLDGYKNSTMRLIFTCSALIFLFLIKYIKELNIFVFNNLLNITNYISLSLAFIVFCATLSLLAFTYCMLLDKDDDEIEFKEMKSNGVYLFKSTIFSIIFLLILFIISHLPSFNIKIITSIFSINFGYAILNSFLIILMICIGILTSLYLIIGIFSSLKTLGFEINKYKLF